MMEKINAKYLESNRFKQFKDGRILKKKSVQFHKNGPFSYFLKFIGKVLGKTHIKSVFFSSGRIA